MERAASRGAAGRGVVGWRGQPGGRWEAQGLLPHFGAKTKSCAGPQRRLGLDSLVVKNTK